MNLLLPSKSILLGISLHLATHIANANDQYSIDCVFSDINDIPLGFVGNWQYEKYRDWRFLSIRGDKTEFQNDTHKAKTASNSSEWRHIPNTKGHPTCLVGNMSESLCIYSDNTNLSEVKGRYTSNLIAYGRPDHLAVFEGLCSINMPSF